MLSRGFKDQIYDIFQLLPPKLQVCFPPILRHVCRENSESVHCLSLLSHSLACWLSNGQNQCTVTWLSDRTHLAGRCVLGYPAP